MGDASTVLRLLVQALDDETAFLEVLGKDWGGLGSLAEPDNEIRTRQIFSYHRLADSLRHGAASVDDMEGEPQSEHPGRAGAGPA